MIVPLSVLQEMFPNESDQSLTDNITAIESAIRGYTNNNFQDRRIRFNVTITDNVITPSNSRISVGDTITISQSINDGFYNVVTASAGQMTVSGELIDSQTNLLTKVIYPADVVKVAKDLMTWTIKYSDKQTAGIKSESISRYSVSYGDMNNESANVNGYPVAIMSRLKPYMRAKF